jgi:selenide, water dikinase
VSEIKLTQTVQKGGCAAKVEAKELRKILAQVRFPKTHPELLVDGSHFDDAGIYKVTDEVALVQTLDFFTPILDSPKLFGAVAATNALSDVYAMGGIPKTAMAILAFPMTTLSNEVIAEVLQGAWDKVEEAGATLVGGHSIDDDTLKFGLSVTGYVHPQRIWSNQGAQEGDLLILTKPLGTGTLTAALKRGERTENQIEEAILSMLSLNNILNLLPLDLHSAIHAATDITGFGLAGHSMQMAKASQKSFEFEISRIPTFASAMELLEKGFLTKAHRTNREYTQDCTTYVEATTYQQLITLDPQTSGGLLLSVSQENAEKLVTHLRGRFASANIIGQVKAESLKNSKVIFRG